MSCSCSKCCSHHEHDDDKEEKKEFIFNLVNLIVGAVLLAIAFTLTYFDPTYGELEWSYFGDSNFFSSYSFIAFIIYTLTYLYLLGTLLKSCIDEIKEGNYINEYTLMAIATIGAFCINEFPEAILVVLFNIVGEMLEDYATGKSANSVKNLINNMPLYAHYISENGEIIEKEPEELLVDDVIEIRPGEKVSVDCRIISGHTSADYSSINGESLPLDLVEGDTFLSGAINLTSTIKAVVLKRYEESTLAKIMNLVQNEEHNKSKSEKFITRFAKYYTPAVLVIALLVFIIGYGASGFVWEGDFGGYTWLYRALSLLLISCPCAMVISVPIAFFSGLGRASSLGILVKGSLALENISKSKTFVFDKTGTLTKGEFVLKNEVDSTYLQIASSLESKSTHPLASAITKANKQPLKEVNNFLNIPGYGIQGEIDGKLYFIGNKKLLESNSISIDKEENTPFKVLYLASKEDGYLASFIVADEIKDDAKSSLQALRDERVESLVMLSGDNQNIATEVADELGIDSALGNLLPEDKLNKIKELSQDGKLTYVGDGINDSPSLLASNTGIAMGALGSDAAIEAADIVITNDDLRKLPEIRRLSKRTMIVVYTAVLFALFIKILFMILVSVGALGSFAMLSGVVSDTGVMIICVLYASSLLLYKPKYIKAK